MDEWVVGQRLHDGAFQSVIGHGILLIRCG
jgi:hypothetical protein